MKGIVLTRAALVLSPASESEYFRETGYFNGMAYQAKTRCTLKALELCACEGMRQSGEVKKVLPFMQLLNERSCRLI